MNQSPAGSPAVSEWPLVRRTADLLARNRIWVLGGLFALLTLVMVLTYSRFGVDDEDRYIAFSHAVLNGRYWNTAYGGEFTWSGPGMPLLLAPFTAAHSPLFITRLFLGPVMIIGAVWAVWEALLLETGPRTAAFGSVGFAALTLYLGFGFVPYGAIYSEPATGFAIALALLSWVKCRASGDWQYALAAGLALAVAAMIRVEWGLIISAGLLVSAIAWPLVRTLNCGLAVLATAVAFGLCVPWLHYTRIESGQYFVWGTSGGLSFYWTAVSKPPLQGDWISPEQVAADPRLKAYRADMVHDRFIYHGPFLWDEYLKTTGLEHISQDPGQFAVNAVKNFSRLVSRYPLSFTATPTLAPLRALPAVVLFALGLLTAVMLSLRRRSASTH